MDIFQITIEGYYCEYCKLKFNTHDSDIKLILRQHTLCKNHVDALEIQSVGICGTFKIIATLEDFYIKCTICDQFFYEHSEAMQHRLERGHVEYLTKLVKNEKLKKQEKFELDFFNNDKFKEDAQIKSKLNSQNKDLSLIDEELQIPQFNEIQIPQASQIIQDQGMIDQSLSIKAPYQTTAEEHQDQQFENNQKEITIEFHGNNFSEETCQRYTQIAKKFLRFLFSRGLELKRKNLKQEYILDFINGNVSQHHNLFAIMSLVKANGVHIWLDKKNIIKKGIYRPHSVLSKQKIKEIIGAFQEDDLVGIQIAFLYKFAARLKDLMIVKVKDLQRKKFSWYPKINGKLRTIENSKWILARIHHFKDLETLANKAKRANQLGKRIKRHLKQIGIDGVKPLDFRISRLIHLNEKVKNVEEIAKWVGHSRIESTYRYVITTDSYFNYKEAKLLDLQDQQGPKVRRKTNKKQNKNKKTNENDDYSDIFD